MNQVLLMGRLTKDPECRYTSDTSMCVAKFTVAVDRTGKKDEADFIGCTAFGKVGEIIEKYFTKGKPICLTGHIQTGSYEKDGKKYYTQTVVVERLEFVPTDKKNGGGEQVSQEGVPEGFEKLTDDDIPF